MATRILIVLQQTDPEEVGTVEELILAKAQLVTVDQGYQEMHLETPEWIIDKLNEVDSEIKSRVKSELIKRLRTAKARRAALKTADEKRRDLDAEIAELEKQVG